MIDHFGLWTSQPIVVLDLETTGFSTQQGDRVVQIAAVRMERMRVVKKWSTLVNPLRPIPLEASEVHGVYDSDVRNAPRFVDAMIDLVQICHGAVPCAYQYAFDRGFFVSEFFEANALNLDIPLLKWPVWIDPLVWVRALSRFLDHETNRNDLTSACKRYGIEIRGAHNAEYDAEACASLLSVIAPEMATCTVSELLRRQPFLKDAWQSRWDKAKAQGRVA